MARYPAYKFTELTSGKEYFLILNEEKGPIVQHPQCQQMATVTIELDAFYCTQCRINGRISGAWIRDLLRTRTTRTR